MKRLNFPLLFFLLLIANSVQAQERKYCEKEKFNYVSQSITNAVKWTYYPHTKDWLSSQTDLYRGPHNNEYEGFKSINMIDFNDGNKVVVAIQYKVGYYIYEYPNLEIEPRYGYSSLFFFITLEDLARMVDVKKEESVHIFPYCFIEEIGIYNIEDDVIRRYKSGDTEKATESGAYYVRTTQDKKEVIRFTLPYEPKMDASFAKTGPYYEIKYWQYKTIINFAKRILGNRR